ncbi:hypothetical protein D3C71_1923620 [compost metagenome]
MRAGAEQQEAQHRHEEDVEAGEEAAIGGRGGGEARLLQPRADEEHQAHAGDEAPVHTRQRRCAAAFFP